jgi:hypothetical protein
MKIRNACCLALVASGLLGALPSARALWATTEWVSLYFPDTLTRAEVAYPSKDASIYAQAYQAYTWVEPIRGRGRTDLKLHAYSGCLSEDGTSYAVTNDYPRMYALSAYCDHHPGDVAIDGYGAMADTDESSDPPFPD